jgi:hypothetical protein
MNLTKSLRIVSRELPTRTSNRTCRNACNSIFNQFKTELSLASTQPGSVPLLDILQYYQMASSLLRRVSIGTTFVSKNVVNYNTETS